MVAAACVAVALPTLVSCAAPAAQRRVPPTVQETPPRAPEPLIPEAYHYFTAANVLAAAGEDSAAVLQYRRALSYDPGSREIRMALAQTYAQMGLFDEAAIVAEGIRPRDPELLQFLGNVYTRTRNFARRLATYEEWARIDSTHVGVWQFLANTYRTEHDTTRWIAAMEALARVQPDPGVFEQLGVLRLERGEMDEAEALFQRALAADSGQKATRVLLGLAQVWSERQEPDSAYAYYSRAVDLNYYNTELRRRFFYFLLQQQRGDEAIEQARQILRLSPDEPDVLYRLAVIEYDRGQRDSSEVHLTQWIARFGDDGLARLLLGRLALERGDSVTAEAQYLQALEVSDTLPEAYLSLVFLYNAREQYDTSAALCREGLAALPDHPALLFSLGSALERQGEFNAAVETFEHLIALEPEHAPALNYLGYMWADKGERLGEALDLIERAVRLQPDNGAFLDSYAWVLYRLGRYREAERQLEEALDHMDDDPVVLEHYGDILVRLGRLDDAHAQWQRALELDPDNSELKAKLRQ